MELKNARPQNGLFHHVESERSRDLYISHPRACTFHHARGGRKRRGRKNQETDSSITEKDLSPPSLKTSAFESDEWREPGSLANCEQAKCSSGFAALATLWMRESTMRSNSGKRGVVFEWQDLIYIYIYIWELGGMSESDRSGRLIKDERANHQCGDVRDNVRPRPS